MTKDELTSLVKHANSSWNAAPYKEEFQQQCRTWFHFLHDLDFDKCMRVVDNYAVTGRTFLPKPGEIRQRVIVGKIPTVMEAWAELQSAREAVYAGRMATAMSPLTQAVVQRLGDAAKGMHTNGDRDKFEGMFNAVVTDWLEEQCATTPST